jgi:hypothetical protein
LLDNFAIARSDEVEDMFTLIGAQRICQLHISHMMKRPDSEAAGDKPTVPDKQTQPAQPTNFGADQPAVVMYFH